MAAAAVSRLAASRVCDGTDAVSDVRPAARVEGAAGTFVGVEGRRVAGAAPGDRGAAAAEPQTEAGLGRPDGDRCPGAAAPQTVAGDTPAMYLRRTFDVPRTVLTGICPRSEEHTSELQSP